MVEQSESAKHSADGGAPDNRVEIAQPGRLAGQHLGPYELTALIGAGGMGEVYRARDVRLARDVAIKVLPARLADDRERLARFQHEARATAALNHPNVITVFDVGVQDGIPWLVMELLQGHTLRASLHSGEPMSLRQALDYAVQIARGLAAAHGANIVHRDLKPENVFVANDGRVKLLDFGLAKLTEHTQALTSAATVDTAAGMVMGTVAYMAPEQARGLDADHRTDLFAFGVVMHEMLTGHLPFRGAFGADVLAAILNADPPPLDNSRPDIPAELSRIVTRCLRKRPELRFQSAADLVFALEGVSPGSGASAVVTRQPSRVGWWVTAVVALLAAALLGNAFTRRPSSDGSAFRTLSATIAIDGLLGLGTPPGEFALSPDGQWLAYSRRTGEQAPEIWLRSLASGQSRRLPDTIGGVYPFWSPDSKRIGFYVLFSASSELRQATSDLRSVPIDGGPGVTIATVPTTVDGQPSWGLDGTILVATGSPVVIYRVPAAGGKPEPVTRLDTANAETSHTSPVWLPDKRRFLFAAIGKPGAADDARGIFVGSLGSTEVMLLVPDVANPRYANGHLVFTSGPLLLAQRFDPDRLELSGTPVRLADAVAQGAADGAPVGHVAALSLSDAGDMLIYAAGTNAVRTRLAWFDHDGSIVGTLGDDVAFKDVFLSPDGRSASVSVYGENSDIWVFDVPRAVRSRLTFDPTTDEGSVWSPDGRRLAIMEATSSHSRLVERQADSTGSTTVLLDDKVAMYPRDWSRDGKYLLYERVDQWNAPTTQSDLWVYSFADGSTSPFMATPFDESAPALSPDGRYIAYVSDESGRLEVYVTTFPTAGAKMRISTSGANWPLWRRDGRELFLVSLDGTLLAVPIAVQPGGLRAGMPRRLFQTSFNLFANHPYDVTSDGQRFIVNTGMIAAGSTPLTLVSHWTGLMTGVAD
jgi:serine/threonine protein kinase/Tol biopolymer transport system component